ncbi:YybH family protein [Sulfurospirillum arsenophilum]|uniref:YybH family protein n=1 Tax=Sulfurospirillum arsenophilum TaxID=56698 RepID=UPI0005AB2919|nr:nuclear transport factor 2 family protein [Sulfurospirillum arsenophilum]
MKKTVNKELVSIEANAVAYLTAFNRADVAGILATYADDGVLMAPGMPTVVGKDELAMIYPAVFDQVGFAMTYEIKEVVQISIDWAFVRSATKGIETNKATGVAIPSEYQELFLLRKSATGAWQTARYSTSKISPTV